MNQLIFILPIVALIIFYAMNKSNKNRKHNNRIRVDDKRNELMGIVKQKMSNEQNLEECDATGDAMKN